MRSRIREGGPIRGFTHPDMPPWRPKPRIFEPHTPRGFELNASVYIFPDSHIAPIWRSPALKEKTLVKVDGGKEVTKILREKKIDKISLDIPGWGYFYPPPSTPTLTQTHWLGMQRTSPFVPRSSSGIDTRERECLHRP